LRLYRLLVLSEYYAGTERPDRFRALFAEALDVTSPRLKAWLDAVEADLVAGRERDWYNAYLRIGDGVARRGELEQWSKVLMTALELVTDPAVRRRVIVFGRGMHPDAPFWRRQWQARD
jgi:hypothetical protein